eukprot:6207424-Pleurochrysis_carterae.AAC.3
MKLDILTESYGQDDSDNVYYAIRIFEHLCKGVKGSCDARMKVFRQPSLGRLVTTLVNTPQVAP